MSKLSVPENARAVADIRTPDGGAWTVYELRPRDDDSPLWLAFKVMLPPATPARWKHRRAFVIFWNPLELRMRKDTEGRAMSMHAPDLYDRLDLLLSLNYGPEWLVRVAGMTEDEILAEADRLKVRAAERRAAARAAKAL